MSVLIPRNYLPIPFWEYPFFIILALVGFFVLNTLLEYGILYDLTRKQGVKKYHLLISVILINLITYPTSHLSLYFAFAFTVYFILFFYILIELAVILIEWILYKWEFQKLLPDMDTNKNFSSKKLLSISAVINLIPFQIIAIIDSILINSYFNSLIYF
ncbi:MAG: hypothetical protein ACFFEY_12190 [Candidatus Thorarchaeota archaeon]